MTDASYWMHTFVSLYSLLYNNREVPFDVRIMSDAVDETFFGNVGVLKRVHGDAEVSWLPVDRRLVASLPARTLVHTSDTVYYKLLIGQSLPTTRRILLLDSDTVVRGPLDELFAVNVDDCILAAVPEPPDVYAASTAAVRLRLPEGAPYFNAGVMRINLDLWRKFAVEERCLANLRQSPRGLAFAEQDALNIVLADRWRAISPAFNYSYEHVMARQDGGVAVDPVLVHYTGPGKPWRYPCRHSYSGDYWHYRRQTPYADYRDPGRTVGHIAHYVARESLRTIRGTLEGVVRTMPWGELMVRSMKRNVYRRT